MAKSLKQEHFIIPGQYKGLWSGYFVEIIFNNGKKSAKIELDGGVRGINCDCDVMVDSDYWIYVK